MDTRLMRYIDTNITKYIDDLQLLCQQPSISAQNEGVSECVNVLKKQMTDVGINTRVVSIQGGNPVVFGELLDSEAKDSLGFYNHYDVQPIDPEDRWKSPPFDLTFKEGKLYARGVSDNKGNIIARLAAVKAVVDVFGEVPVNLKFFFEGEEEIGSPHLPFFVEANRDLLKADGYIWEGDGVDQNDKPVITLGAKGILFVEIRASGPKRDVHSSLAPIIANPAWRLVWLLSTLKDPNEKIKITGWYDDVVPPTKMEYQLLNEAPFDEAAEKEEVGITEYLHGVTGVESRKALYFSPTCNICGLYSGYIGTGSKTVLPSQALVKIDFRLVEAQNPDTQLKLFRNYLQEQGFTDVQIVHYGGYEPAKTPPTDPFVIRIIETAEQVYGKKPVIWPTTAGTSPIYVIKNWMGIPVASGGGVGYPGSKVHAPNENIRLTDFITSIKYLATLIGSYPT